MNAGKSRPSAAHRRPDRRGGTKPTLTAGPAPGTATIAWVLRRGVAPSLRFARAAPWLATLSLGIAFGLGWFGADIRAGIFPFAISATVVLLAVCCQGLLLAHPHATAGLRAAIWWSTVALAGPAGFFLPVGVGTLLGIDENGVSGWVALGPMAAMAFGLMTMPIALTLLAVGVRRAGVLPTRAAVAALVAGPLPPLLLVVGGLAEGAAESVGTIVLVALFVGCWLVVGRTLPTDG